MKKNIQGPCLPHCYNEPNLIYLLIGFILGVFFYYLTQRILVIPRDENGNEIPRTQLFPSASPKN